MGGSEIQSATQPIEEAPAKWRPRSSRTPEERWLEALATIRERGLPFDPGTQDLAEAFGLIFEDTARRATAAIAIRLGLDPNATAKEVAGHFDAEFAKLPADSLNQPSGPVDPVNQLPQSDNSNG